MKKGDIVECIDNHSITSEQNLLLLRHGYKFPKKSYTYIIRGINETRGIYLEEIINPILNTNMGLSEVGFHQDYFKVLEINEEISQLIEQLQINTYEAIR